MKHHDDRDLYLAELNARAGIAFGLAVIALLLAYIAFYK